MVGKRQTKANGYNSRLEALNYFANEKINLNKFLKITKEGDWFCGNLGKLSDASAKYLIQGMGLVEVKGDKWQETFISTEYSLYIMPENWRLYANLPEPTKPEKDKLHFKEFYNHIELTNWANGPDGTDYIISISTVPSTDKWIIFYIK